MAVSRAERRSARENRVLTAFDVQRAPTVLDMLEIMEIAWHDCYGEISPPEEVIDDVLVLSRGDLGELIKATRQALADWRDVRLAAAVLRKTT